MAKSLKKLIKQRPTSADVTTAMREIRKDGPRGAIVLASALIEDILRSVILANMRALKPEEHDQLFVATAPLSSFSAKKIAYALKLIGPDTRRDLDRLREIRNVCAHAQVPVAFEMPEIQTSIRNFLWLGKIIDHESKPPRELFISLIRILMIHLIAQMPGSEGMGIHDSLRSLR